MKSLFFFSLLAFAFFSCGNEEKTLNADSLRTDSALKAQQQTVPIPAKPDTEHTVALPPVMEGDLLFQNASDEQSLAFGKATRSKYNNIGVIFQRPKDHTYVVMDARDSLHAIPLSEWIGLGNGGHFALLRLKNANAVLNEKKTTDLRRASKLIRGKKADHYFSWSDAEVYPSEMAWKLYHAGIKIELSTPGALSQLDLSGDLVKQQMKNKYGSAIPMDEKVVTPDDLYKSSQLEVIFER